MATNARLRLGELAREALGDGARVEQARELDALLVGLIALPDPQHQLRALETLAEDTVGVQLPQRLDRDVEDQRVRVVGLGRVVTRVGPGAAQLRGLGQQRFALDVQRRITRVSSAAPSAARRDRSPVCGDVALRDLGQPLLGARGDRQVFGQIGRVEAERVEPLARVPPAQRRPGGAKLGAHGGLEGFTIDGGHQAPSLVRTA